MPLLKSLPRWLSFLFALAPLALAVLATGSRPFAQHDHEHDHALAALEPEPAGPQRSAPWPARVVELAGALPIQDGGRVKPLYTHAKYMLVRFNNKSTVKTPSGDQLGPVEWMLDALFFRPLSDSYAVFMVQDSQALEAIGLPVEGKHRRDRYSFAELKPGISRLLELAGQYQAIEEKQRSSVQQQVFLLASNVSEYMALITHLDFARHALPVGAGPGLAQIFGGREQVPYSALLDELMQVRDLQGKLAAEPQHSPEFKSITALFNDGANIATGTEMLAMLPPEASAEQQPAWYSPLELLLSGLREGGVAPAHVQLVQALEGMTAAGPDLGRFQSELERFHGQSVALATQRGEYAKIPLELRYYGLDLLYKGQILFVIAFLLAAWTWIAPRSRWLYAATAVSVLLPTLLLIAAITLRCMIRGRPPVSTLYETLLFVTATGAVLALLSELFTRQRIALSAAAVLGLIGLYFASGYETLDKRDTMPQLVAVLDTNFWLATHVTAITIGYSAGVLAALLGSIYLLAKVIGFKRDDAAFFHGLGRIVYGVLCFGLIFSTVGTILGGIWANESWGRFWGWDPKENGALLICLSQLVMLHARMAGLLREFGLCMAAAFGGTVIGFSWFGVNLLGVGLHSYGFTSGINTALWTYYGLQWGIIGLAGAHWFIQRTRASAARDALAAAGQAKRTGAQA
jgi:ABC-type transport system involved in cytochrome c biogenesis permease subunit